MQKPGLPCSSNSKESACNAGDLDSIPSSGESPGGGNGNPLQYSCLESSMNRGAWWATAHGVAESDDWVQQQTTGKQNPGKKQCAYLQEPLAGLCFLFAITIMVCSSNSIHVGWIRHLLKATREGNGNPFQYFCLENPMDRGAGHGVARIRHNSGTKPINQPTILFSIVALWIYIPTKSTEGFRFLHILSNIYCS